MAIDVDFLGHAERVVLLRRAAAESGYREDTTSDMLRAVLLDERGPGVCTAPDCRCVVPNVPMETEGLTCPRGHEKSVLSVVKIAGWC